jgi:hypothetical protein
MRRFDAASLNTLSVWWGWGGRNEAIKRSHYNKPSLSSGLDVPASRTAAAIRQFDDKTIAPAQLRENQAHFANRQHARQMSLLGGQLEPQVSKLPIEELLVKKYDRIESDIAVHGEMSQKRFDFRRLPFSDG